MDCTGRLTAPELGGIVPRDVPDRAQVDGPAGICSGMAQGEATIVRVDGRTHA